jgi:NAD(P)-dependent dehydrogenase (short-subunit alcohol dehydrogenase family)/carbon monoxide dehydrogenase subunit G
MLQVRHAIDLPAEPERVFHYLSDFRTIAEWDPSVLWARALSSGEARAGSRYRLALRFGGRTVPMEYEILSLERGGRVHLRGRGSGFSAEDRIAVATGPQGTRVDYTATVQLDDPPGRIGRALLQRLFARNARRAVTRLRALWAGGPSPPRLTLATRLADQALLPGLLGFTRLGYRLGRRRRPFASGLLAGRVVVLTGGTSGIGLAAADALARCGADLVVVGRDGERLERLRQRLAAENGAARIRTEQADLSCMAHIRALAERLNADPGRIDVLINNAGALFPQWGRTPEGIERTLATDLLGPFLLTRLLLPALRAGSPSRIVNVASGGMYTQGIDPRALEMPPGDYSGPTAYARAKRGLVALSALWAEELAPDGIVVHAMHPGWVDTPGLSRSLPAFHRALGRCLRDAGQGADTLLWLAAAPDAAHCTGLFWLDRRPRATSVFPGTHLPPRQARALAAALARLAGIGGAGAPDGA